MEKDRMDKTKSFFMHNEKNKGKKESLVDFFLSWTLRCIIMKKREYHNPKMEEYCKNITSVLLFGNAENLNNYKVEQVKEKNEVVQVILYLMNFD